MLKLASMLCVGTGRIVCSTSLQLCLCTQHYQLVYFMKNVRKRYHLVRTPNTSSYSVGLGGSLLGLSDSCLQVDWDSSGVLVEARDS